MNWRDNICVNAAGIRAVNLERDAGGGDDYIITDRALSVLQALATALATDQAPAAWNIVGPYGAGKSAFARYVSRLLGPGDRERALQICTDRDPELASRFRRILDKGRGFCPVHITGCPQPLPERLLARLAIGADDFFVACGEANPLPKTIFRAAPEKAFDAAGMALDEVNRAVAACGGAGVLIMVDEMGKFLEHEASSPDAASAHMMQWLAEYTAKPAPRKSAAPTGKTALFGMMPESLGRRKLGRELQNEWRKVQGRFQSTAYQVSPEAMLRLMSHIVVRNFDPATERDIRKAMAAPAQAVWKTGILSGVKSKKAAGDLLIACHPLHPVAAALLPLLSQAIGQSERTMFSFYGVEEEGGFSDCLRGLRHPADLIMPHQLYDYFIAGRPMGSADIAVQRKWAEAVAAMDRLGKDSPDAIRVLKTVALFNLVGTKGAFAASESLLSAVFGAKTAKATLDELSARSLVNYRRHLDAYRIWEGSDFDLEAAERTEMGKIERVNVADELNRRCVVAPIVARKHAIETGNLRRLMPVFADAENWSKLPAKAAEPRLIIFLPRNAQDKKTLGGKIASRFSGDVRVTSDSLRVLESVFVERRALEAIRENNPEILGDRAVSLELKARLNAAIQREAQAVQSLTAPAPGRVFHWHRKTLPAATHRDIQTSVSLVMDEVYDRAPQINNELINRDHPSPQAHAARKKLLLALRENGNLDNLGIEKYPPERAIYLSLFQRTGLHVKGRDGWMLCAPGEAAEDSCNLTPAWNCIREFMASTEKSLASLAGLDSVLQAAPYGIKKGILPILYISVILLERNSIAVYEDGSYVPFFDGPHIERFLAKPDSFRFQYVVMDDARAKFMDRYAALVSGRPRPGGAILAAARPLAKFLAMLPEYSKNTEEVSPEAQAFRRAIQNARSPHEMLFNDIPAALGFPGDSPLTKKRAAEFSEKLGAVQRELQNAHPALCSRFREMLARSLGMDEAASPDDIRVALSARAEALIAHTADPLGTRNFLIHATDRRGDGGKWLERMMTFLAGKSSAKWAGADESRAEFNLAKALRRMADFESLLEFKAQINGTDAATKPGRAAHDTRLPANLRDACQKIAGILDSLEEDERLLILAELWHNGGRNRGRTPKKQ